MKAIIYRDPIYETTTLIYQTGVLHERTFNVNVFKNVMADVQN